MNKYIDLNTSEDEKSIKEPKLFLDVNLGKGVKSKLMIYDGQDYHAVVDSFSMEH